MIIPDAFWNSDKKYFQPHKGTSHVPSPFDQENVDIPLSKSAIDSIEVMLGPLATDSEHIIVEALLRKFTKGGIVRESSQKGKMR